MKMYTFKLKYHFAVLITNVMRYNYAVFLDVEIKICISFVAQSHFDLTASNKLAKFYYNPSNALLGTV